MAFMSRWTLTLKRDKPAATEQRGGCILDSVQLFNEPCRLIFLVVSRRCCHGSWANPSTEILTLSLLTNLHIERGKDVCTSPAGGFHSESSLSTKKPANKLPVMKEASHLAAVFVVEEEA